MHFSYSNPVTVLQFKGALWSFIVSKQKLCLHLAYTVCVCMRSFKRIHFLPSQTSVKHLYLPVILHYFKPCVVYIHVC